MGINSGEFLPAAMLPLILLPLVRLLRHGQDWTEGRDCGPPRSRLPPWRSAAG